ncbi:EAL and HDOD domain-containing protein [Desulfolithobacter sp.]
MDVYLARQPIFDRHKRVFGYELLYRTAGQNICQETDGDLATTRVAANSLLSIGMETLVGTGRAFINFTEKLLLENLPSIFPPDMIVVEVLEHVPPSPEITAACQQLREQGYVLALDDFVFSPGMEPLIDLADIIKVDIMQTPLDRVEDICRSLRGRGIRLLAEKIETYQEFDQAVQLGFSYFQGYFFRRPEVLKRREVGSTKLNLFNLLAEVNKPGFSMGRIEELVSSDASLSYKLLRYINSAYYSLVSEVTSIRHALIYLGEKGIRQFVSLVATSFMAGDKPEELLRVSVIRARLCELLAERGRMAEDKSNYFLLGLFSLLDAMLDTEMENIMEQLPVTTEIKDALVHRRGPMRPLLEAVIAQEQGNWDQSRKLLVDIGVDPDEIMQLYLESIAWADMFTAGIQKE